MARATQTLRNVRSAWVKEQEVQIEDGQISGYKVNMLVTFVLDDNAELDDAAERGSGGARGAWPQGRRTPRSRLAVVADVVANVVAETVRHTAADSPRAVTAEASSHR